MRRIGGDLRNLDYLFMELFNLIDYDTRNLNSEEIFKMVKRIIFLLLIYFGIVYLLPLIFLIYVNLISIKQDYIMRYTHIMFNLIC